LAPVLQRIGQTAEDAGFASLWVMDHFFQIEMAQYADACNLYAFEGADVVRAKLAVLRRHCDEIGRPFDEIERTAIGIVDIGPGKMSSQEIIDHCHTMSDAGIQHLVLSLARVHEIMPIEKMGQEVIPAVSRF